MKSINPSIILLFLAVQCTFVETTRVLPEVEGLNDRNLKGNKKDRLKKKVRCVCIE